MGISLKKENFRNVFIHPKAILVGLIAQMVLLPLTAFFIVFFLDLPAIIKVGFILIAACPGGTASNLVVYLLRGNVALCISLTAVTSLLIQVTLPLIVNLGLIVFVGHTEHITLPIGETIFNVFLVTIVPTFLGVLLREKRPSLAIKLEKPFEYIMTILLLFVFATIIFFEERGDASIINDYGYLLPVALALNFFSMLVGYIFARLMQMDNRNNYTISIQVGLQNSALAIFVGSTLMDNTKLAMVAVVYSSFTFFSTAFFGWIAKRFG